MPLAHHHRPPLSRPLLGLLFILAAAGCGEKQADVFQGYVEGEYVLVAAPLPGRLDRLAVSRGDQVSAGTLLYALEAAEETAAADEARQHLQQAEERLADLRKGERPSELAALSARLDQARTTRGLSCQELQRRQALFRERVISTEELDRAETACTRDEAAEAQLRAELQTARLGARPDQVKAAAAEVGAARAQLDRALWALAQKGQPAPAAAVVFDTLYREGEFVPAGRPVVSLLPPGNIKVRLFVPEASVGTLHVGEQVSVSFDGGGTALPASISFISPRAEYTPPVIYSRETRTKLVFLVEARPAPAAAARLHPGQPVEVRLEAGP